LPEEGVYLGACRRHFGHVASITCHCLGARSLG
jgi:hypothetical protein